MRVMALHALAYCQRLFYLEEVEEIRVADHRVFAGRQLHSRLEAKEDGEAMSLDLASESLGLLGKVDCLRRRDGSYLPYEHKRGLPARRLDGTPEAWLSGSSIFKPTNQRTRSAPSHRLRGTARRNVRLSDPRGACSLPRGARHRAGAHRRPRKDRLRWDAIAEAQRLRETVERPPITDNPRLCEHCSLAPVCLPEEVRQDRDPERDPLRLFPQDRDGTTLHVVAQGTSVGVSGDSLVVKQRDGPDVKHPARSIETLLLHGFTQVSTQAIRKCVEYGIGVHWLSVSGSHTTSLVPTAGQVQRRIRQYQALTAEDTCLRLAKQLASAKVEGQYRYLMRASRGNDDERSDVQVSLNSIQSLLASILGAGDRDSLRGLEGLAAVHYFAALRKLLGRWVHDDLRSDSRSRKPPRDRFNACLSYGYGLLHTAVMGATLASGLEPALGFFHTPRSAAYPLVLDLMELFRVTLWDMPLVGSLNRGQWDPVADFAVTKTKVWLSGPGRKKAIGLFEDRLQETWKHPVLNYSLSYARSIELEARLLEKEWTGEPGLFARSRLR